MSKIYVSGPAYAWIGTRVASFGTAYSASDFDFFGFTERGLTVTMRGLFEEVNVDYAGLMPADVSMLGIDATCGGVFTRYNESILRNLMAFLNGVQAGFGPIASVGTLMQSEPPFQGAGVMAGPPLLVYSPYGFKSEFSDMIKTFRFYSAYVSEPLPQTLSVRRKAPEISWKAIPAFGTVSGTTFQPNAPPYNAYQLFAVDDVSANSLPPVD